MSHGGRTAASKLDEVCCAHRTRTAPLNARQVAVLTLCGRMFAGQEGCSPVIHLEEWPGRTMRRARRDRQQLWATGVGRGSSEAASSTTGQQRGRSDQRAPPSVARASWRARAGQNAPAKPNGDVRERVHARRRAHPLVDCIRLCMCCTVERCAGRPYLES